MGNKRVAKNPWSENQDPFNLTSFYCLDVGGGGVELKAIQSMKGMNG